MKINLFTIGANLAAKAAILFDKIVDLPLGVRPDDKIRTGVQILVREIGTRNLILLPVRNPSDAAKFFVNEKAVRSEVLEHYSSGNSADELRLRFAGSVTIEIGTKLQASVSGLKAEEDVAIAVALLAYVLEWPVDKVIEHIKEREGILPDELSDKEHYLYHIARS